MSRLALVLTCEHGGNRVPPQYRALFREHAALLQTHRGWDPGALALARCLGRRWKVRPHFSETTRLLVELNRSRGHPSLFSAITRTLSEAEKRQILGRYYDPYRSAVEEEVAAHRESGAQVLHLSVHSFTPVLDGVRRNADVGLLYDPRRAEEYALAVAWQTLLRERDAEIRVRRNYPYRGTSDAFVTDLRRRFPTGYLGLELEVNQALLLKGADHVRALCGLLAACLEEALAPARG